MPGVRVRVVRSGTLLTRDAWPVGSSARANRGLYCYAHMQGGPCAYASHYALSGIRKLGACTSLASPNASHYAARRTPPPSKINRKRQYIHVIIACVTVRWPCGCLIRTTCHVYGLWISAGAPRPAEGGASSTYHVSALRIRPFHCKALPRGRCPAWSHTKVTNPIFFLCLYI